MKKITERIQLNTILVGMILLLAATLIPLFWIAHYNFISVDDFTFTQNAGAIWQETGSVWKVMLGQVKYTWDFWHDWQGTYFGVWSFTTAMGIFAEDAYYMTTYLTLGGLVVSELLGFMLILVKCVGADKVRAAIIAIGVVMLQVLLTPVPVEGYFWFCGSMLYTFLYSLAWYLIALQIVLATKRERSLKTLIPLEIGIILLTFAVAGGNYVVALSMLLFHVFYNIWMFVKKHPQRIMTLCNLVFFLIAFVANVAAPGNQVRQAASGVTHMSFFEAIFTSLLEAWKYLVNNTIPPCIILGIMFAPLFVGIVKKKNMRYPFPLLVTVITFGLFAAQFSPTLYALRIIGAGRIQNLYRFTFYIWLYANELYWIGWLRRKFVENKTEILGGLRVVNKCCPVVKKLPCLLLPLWMVCGILLCVTLHYWGGSTLTSVSAIRDLRSGNAKRYYAEFQERKTILEDESQPIATLKPFSVKPYLLYFGDIYEDPADWVNATMAEYYGKEEVRLYVEE